MLRLIATSRALDLGRLRATTFSVAVHAGLILAATTSRATQPVRSLRASASAPLERVRYIVAQPRAEATKTATRKARRATAPAIAPVAKVAKLATLSLTIPAADLDTAVRVDDVDLTGKITDSLDFKSGTLAEVIGAALAPHRSSEPMPGGIYRAEAVDRIVTPFGDNPKPEYPRSLESRGVEADFTVMFVVDSTGRVDVGSVQVPKNVHHLFADAVSYALSRSRYLPAQLGGRPVRQLVAQEFVFRMVR